MLPYRHGLPTIRRSVHSLQRSLSTNSRLTNLTSVAPMVDITTPNFLELLHIISGYRHAYYTEMHHAHAIHQHQDHLDRFVGTPRRNVVVQLGGSDPNLLASATRLLQDSGYSEVNINVGCPSHQVQQGQFGAVLMKTPSLVADILNAMDDGKVSIPVTIKCRIGVDHLDTLSFFQHFVETLMQSQRPPPHLIVHARKCILKGLTPKKNRTIPPLNYQRVYELAKLYPDLPISINGGFTTTDSIKEALVQVDGCMIGRKVMDSPLFLQEIDRDIYGVPENEIKTPLTVIDEYLDYTDRLLALKLDKDVLFGLPPITVLSRPLMMLFAGKKGRVFRRELFAQLQQTPRSSHNFRDIVTQSLVNAGLSH